MQRECKCARSACIGTMCAHQRRMYIHIDAVVLTIHRAWVKRWLMHKSTSMFYESIWPRVHCIHQRHSLREFPIVIGKHLPHIRAEDHFFGESGYVESIPCDGQDHVLLCTMKHKNLRTPFSVPIQYWLSKATAVAQGMCYQIHLNAVPCA